MSEREREGRGERGTKRMAVIDLAAGTSPVGV